jgi:acyl carrier protein
MFTEQIILQNISTYLRELLSLEEESLGPNAALLEAGLIDSVSIFNLIGFMEEQFAIAVSDEDVTLENFETPAAIARLVANKIPH